MVRLTALFLVLGIVGLGSSAYAEACACMWADTHDTRAALLFSAVPILASTGADEAEGGEPRDAPQQGILWCTSSDDPRCMPVDNQGPDPVELARSTPPANARSWCRPEQAPRGSTSRPIDDAGQARAGIKRRVDRPPCA